MSAVTTILIIFTILVSAILIVVYGVCHKSLDDLRSPLNFVMYQEPKTPYSDQLVNVWVEKPWRSDGKRIPCKLEEGSQLDVPRDQRTLIIYSHGNAENLMMCSAFIRELSETLKCDAVCWDYSGYGLNESDTFERTAEGINSSLRAIVDYMVDDYGYKMNNIVLWGYSLGTGPSTHVAAELSEENKLVSGLVLFGSYRSIKGVVSDHTNKWVADQFDERWDNEAEIKKVKSPILLLHGQSDGLIKAHNSQILNKSNPKSKLVILPNTGHTNFSWNETTKEIRNWATENSVPLL